MRARTVWGVLSSASPRSRPPLVYGPTLAALCVPLRTSPALAPWALFHLDLYLVGVECLPRPVRSRLCSGIVVGSGLSVTCERGAQLCCLCPPTPALSSALPRQCHCDWLIGARSCVLPPPPVLEAFCSEETHQAPGLSAFGSGSVLSQPSHTTCQVCVTLECAWPPTHCPLALACSGGAAR